MVRFRVVLVLPIVLQLLPASAQRPTREEGCPETTRPHMTRCDQYYRCTELSKEAHVWVTTQCQKGLVYTHQLGTCVVPDNDWECNLSAENDPNHSEENVYGIDNLRFPAIPNTLADSDEQPEEVHISTVPDTVPEPPKGTSMPEINDIESSGDGSSERMETDEPSTVAPQTTTTTSKPPIPVTTPPTKKSGILSPSQLDSFLAYYDTKKNLRLKAKLPPRLNENNYLQHLKRIVNQQKQLNQMADFTKTMDYFTYQDEPTERVDSKQGNVEAETTTSLNLSPGMQDIIKSILDISRQAIVNQKSTPDQPPKEPIVKPIFIPISVNPVPQNVPSPTTTEQPPKPISSSNYNPEPVNYPSPLQNTIRYPGVNDSFNSFQQVLYDAYGNKFVPKDSYQMLAPPGYPGGGFNSFPGAVQQAPSFNVPAPGAIYSSDAYISPTPRPVDPASYFPGPKPLSTQNTPSGGDFESLSDILDRIKQLESIDSAEGDESESTEQEAPAPKRRHSDDSGGEASDEDNPPDGSNADSQYKRKLFTLGDTTFDYEQYKDSMLPLVDANPDDERISVVMCMVGSRQPNQTDCFKYYICNPHNGVFQSYTCPPTTAFNKHSRMCDITSYKQCKAQMSPPVSPRPQLRTHKEPTKQHSSVSRIKNELRKAQKYVELIRLEANKLRFHNSAPAKDQQIIFLPSMDLTRTGEGSKVRQKSSSHRKKSPASSRRTTSTTAKPPKSAESKRKLPRCRLEGRMPDPMDQSNYYVCHKKSPNKFIKLKMACPAELIYCADTQYCTLRTNC